MDGSLALPGSVRWPPADLAAEPDHPFDLSEFFSPIPQNINAAPLYLDALAEFDPKMAVCFPESQRPAVHERALRRQEKLAQVVDPTTDRAAAWVRPEAVDETLAMYDAGFEKLARAQERPVCVFELGPTVFAEVPHLMAARQTVTVARLRNDRDLRRGEIVRAIETVGIELRLARDLKPRGSMICQIVAVAIELNVRELILDILRCLDLQEAHVDRLLGMLARQEQEAVPHPLAEGHRVEYVYLRTVLRDLEHRTGDFSPEGLLRLGGKTFGEIVVSGAKILNVPDPGRGPQRSAKQIDAEVARMGSVNFQREAGEITKYYRELIKVSKQPFQEQMANFPKPSGFFLTLPRTPQDRHLLAVTRSLAGLRLARCMAAVRRWQLAQRSPLPDLESVVRAAGIGSVPADPFGDGPIRLNSIGGAPVVYSVGADGRDDGGQLDWNNGQQPGDFVLHLHPPVPTRTMQIVQLPAAGTPAKRTWGSFRLFHILGTTVDIHWSWFLVAIVLIYNRPVVYSSFAWDVIEYIAGFVLVLLHEFGHVFACRQVGGAANRVLLWPLGGLAFTQPPPRPSPYLWTTMAGPLVNLILAPILIGLAWATVPSESPEAIPDLYLFLRTLAVFNLVMLVFNLLPVFPLDGGRILHAILWWCLGQARGLAIAAGIGIVFGAGLGILAVWASEWVLGTVAGFLCYGSLRGLQVARELARIDRTPRRSEYRCPACEKHPPVGAFWRCNQCSTLFDIFDSVQVCPKCRNFIIEIPCPECGRARIGGEWHVDIGQSR